jgi:Replication-relaxation
LNTASYTLTRVDRELLEAVWDFRFMTAKQLLRYRGLKLNSLPKLRERLLILCGKSQKVMCPSYLQRFYQLRATPYGTLPFVYALSRLGGKQIVRLGKVARKLPFDTDHHLSINEFFLAARLLEKVEPRVSRYDFQHEWRLKHSPLPVSLYLGRSEVVVKFVPDGLLEFRLDLGTQKAPKRIFLEMDLDTHERHAFKKKIAAYTEFFASGAYIKHFGNVRNSLVLFATPAGASRCEEMRKWTHEQLHTPLYAPASYAGSRSLAEQEFKRFWFLSVPPGSLDPVDTFLSPIALPVFDTTPRPLIYLPSVGA